MEIKKSKNYLEPSEFFAETLKCLAKDEASDRLGSMFIKLCEKYANHPKFVRYHHIREDLISAALIGCVKGFLRFRPYRNILERDEDGNIISSVKREWDGEIIEYDYRFCNNPFAYFTTCAHNEILQFLKEEYKSKNILNKIRIENGLEAEASYVDMLREQERNDEEEYVPVDFDVDTESEENTNVIEWQ